MKILQLFKPNKVQKKDYSDHDIILNAIDENIQISTVELHLTYNEMVSDFNKICHDLLDAGYIVSSRGAQMHNFLTLTKVGTELKRNGGYNLMRQEQDKREKMIKDKEVLEFTALKQTVRKGSFEFYFMLFGSIGGLVSFVYVCFQVYDWIVQHNK